jgi:hypothetical protein
LASGQQQALPSEGDAASVSIVATTGQGDKEPVRKGMDGIFGTGLVGPGDVGAGILDLSLVSDSLHDLAQLSGSGGQAPVGGAVDSSISEGSGVGSRAAAEAATAGSVSSPDLPARDALTPVTNSANPFGQSDNLAAEILMLGSRHRGSNPPPPISCTAVSGQGATNNITEDGVVHNIATFTANDPSCSYTDFSATADFGDGQGTFGASISGNGSSGFTVDGSHVYMEEGTYPVTIDIDNANGTSVPSIFD